MTLGKPAVAHESIVSRVRASNSPRWAALLKPRLNAAPGIPLGAMAHERPWRRRVGQVSGSQISTDTHPNCRATWHVRSMSHFSPAELKHQNTIDCRIRPRRGLCSSLDPAAEERPGIAVAA